MSHLTQQQATNLVILSIATSTISFIAAICVVVTICVGGKGYCRGALKGIKVSKLSFHLIGMVCVSDAIRTFGNLLGAPVTESPVCGIQTFLKIFGGTASYAWVSVITYVIFKLLITSDKWDQFTVEKHKRIFHCICWLFAFINAIIPTAGGFYANAASWCFIDASDAGHLLRLFCYYIWVVIIWIVIAVLYIRIWKYLKEKNIELSTVPTVSRLIYYPLIFFMCWFPSLLRRFWNVVSVDGEAPIVLIGLQIFFSNLYGLANAIMYGYVVRDHFRSTSESVSRQKDSVISSATDLKPLKMNYTEEVTNGEKNGYHPDDDKL